MSYSPSRVFAAACLGMLLFGIVITTIGSILPAVIERFAVSRGQAGTLLSILSLGVLAGSLVFGPFVDRFGYRGLLVGSTALVGAALEGVALAESFAPLQASVFLVGASGGAINGATNAVVSDISGDQRGARLSLLGVFFGVGAFGLPFVLSFLMRHFNYATLMAALGGVVVIPLAYFLVVRFPAPKQAQGFPIRQGLRLLRDPVLLLMGLVLFLQSGIEVTAGGWTASYFHVVLGLDADRGVFYLSVFWLGMVFARLAMGRLLVSYDPATVLRGFLAVAAAGALLLVATGWLAVAAPAVFLLGFGLAATFPIMLGYVGDLYPDLTGTAFSIVFVIALTGGSLLPLATGLASEAIGLRLSFLLIPASLLLMLLLFAAALRRRSGSAKNTR